MEDDDIAAAMGFSSFGGTKKRKFEQTNSPKANTSGANSTKLGVRSKIAADADSVDTNASEIMKANDPSEHDSQSDSNQPTTNTRTKGKQKQPEATGLAAFLARGQNMPDKLPSTKETQAAVPSFQEDPAAAEMVSFGGPPISRADLNTLRHGARDESGDMAYFLPSFVEDPWVNFKKGRK